MLFLGGRWHWRWDSWNGLIFIFYWITLINRARVAKSAQRRKVLAVELHRCLLLARLPVFTLLLVTSSFLVLGFILVLRLHGPPDEDLGRLVDGVFVGFVCGTVFVLLLQFSNPVGTCLDVLVQTDPFEVRLSADRAHQFLKKDYVLGVNSEVYELFLKPFRIWMRNLHKIHLTSFSLRTRSISFRICWSLTEILRVGYSTMATSLLLTLAYPD